MYTTDGEPTANRQRTDGAMKVIGLLSGGKGSIYNMMCCKKEGHEIVCLVHMCPPPTYPMYSPMYQTVTSEGTLVGSATLFGDVFCG